MTQVKEEIDRFVQEVLNRYKEVISTIILFGSASRGDLTEESDIDFLIVTHNAKRLDLLKKITRVATRMVLEYGRPISTKVYDLDQYEYLKRLETPFMKNIEREGEILWKRKQRKR
ncbi:MAG: nucleotidyltransferase domain-containing protein [bacterium]|nr:nucleotidyltransferase domain-containing protein [bacterium]